MEHEEVAEEASAVDEVVVEEAVTEVAEVVVEVDSADEGADEVVDLVTVGAEVVSPVLLGQTVLNTDHQGRGGGGGRGAPRGRGGKPGLGRKGPGAVTLEPHKHAGVYIAKGKEHLLVTRNMDPGQSVYGEKRIAIATTNAEGEEEKVEYRVWNPFRSKLAAGILGGLDDIHVSCLSPAREDPTDIVDPSRQQSPVPRCRFWFFRLARLGYRRPRGYRLRGRVLAPFWT